MLVESEVAVAQIVQNFPVLFPILLLSVL
jgi:hypothetical protein